MIAERNARWTPRLERGLRPGKTWMVIAGAARMAGDEGVPTLLRARSCRVEQF